MARRARSRIKAPSLPFPEKVILARFAPRVSNPGRVLLVPACYPGASIHPLRSSPDGFIVPLWDAELPNQIERVSTTDATAMALRLAREEGLFAGTSTGANVVAALRTAEQLGPNATVVTIMCDTGMKYLKVFGKIA